MQFVKEKSNHSSFLNWEIFVRERELASYKLEKDRRQNLYLKLQKVISECREESKQTKEKLEFLIQEKLFGDVDVHKLILDYKIPPQHNIQFYLKARKPEELEAFFKDSEYYLTKLIRRTNQQLEHLHFIKSDANRAEKYERRNYLRFLDSSRNDELSKEFKEKVEYENNFIKSKDNVVLSKMQMQNNLNQKQIRSEIKILKAIDDHIKANNYSKFSLTPEQKEELNKIRRAEILRNAIAEKAVSDADLVRKHKESQGDSRVYFHRHNESADFEGFDLTYNQKMDLMQSKDSLSADMSGKEITDITKEMEKMEAEKKHVAEILKRKKVEDSLRKRKRYHLPEIKRVRTSLDKYDDEEQYHLVRSYKESGIEVNKSAFAKNQAANSQPYSPKI